MNQQKNRKRIKQKQFIDNMYLHELRWLNDIYVFYGGRHTTLKAKRQDPLYQECRDIFERLKRAGKIYKRGGYKGNTGGWFVNEWYVSPEAYNFRKHGDPLR